MTAARTLGPYQDAIVFEAQRAMAAAIEDAIARVAKARSMTVDELKEWLAIDASRERAA